MPRTKPPARTRAATSRTARTPASIDAYLATLDRERRDLLANLRRIIRTELPDAVECFSYGMPAFRVDGRVVAGFQATTRGGAVYPFSGATLGALGDALAGFSRTKSALHLRVDRPLSAALVRKVVRARVAEAPQRRAPRSRSARAPRSSSKT
jgi:uncharacterized protein YdhG (YjbR/CyaY superfamily)